MAFLNLLAVAASLVLVALSGCSSTDPSLQDGSLSLDRIVRPSAPPVNLTAAEIHQFPPLEHLVSRWDAAYAGKGGSLSIPHPYEDGLAIVHAIQLKRPDVNWPERNVVLFVHNGEILGLMADYLHH